MCAKCNVAPPELHTHTFLPSTELVYKKKCEKRLKSTHRVYFYYKIGPAYFLSFVNKNLKIGPAHFLSFVSLTGRLAVFVSP